MLAKDAEKKRAISLRKRGKTYSEIQKIIPVSRSSLSTWLRGVELPLKNKKQLNLKKKVLQKRGAKARVRQRDQVSKEIKSVAKNEVGVINERELWLIGIALYWAEGSKEKSHSRTVPSLEFSNSDPKMVRLYIRWLTDIVGVNPDHINCYLYIHQSAKSRLPDIKDAWLEATGLPSKQISRVYYKKHNVKTVRKNIGDNYFGMLRIWVSRSTNLNRKVSGWIEGISEI